MITLLAITLQPFVRWAGGKRPLLSAIMKYVPERFNTYYEPFVGGGAVLFALQPAMVVINDVNSELMNCYRVIRNSPDELVAALGQHQSTTIPSVTWIWVRSMPVSPQ